MLFSFFSSNLREACFPRIIDADRREQLQNGLISMSSLFRASIFATALLSALFSSDHAKAAFAAERDLIGFNSTGTVFVFEQFGRQDGSGFPFSELYYINTETNLLPSCH